jgi:hypothetical protein
VLVNGKENIAARIDSQNIQCEIALERSQTIKFVEILSEENVQLLFICLDSSNGKTIEESAELHLSNGRLLRVCLTTAHTIKLEINYHVGALATSDCAMLQAVPISSVVDKSTQRKSMNRELLDRLSTRISTCTRWIPGRSLSKSDNSDQLTTERGLFEEVLRSRGRDFWTPAWLSLLASLVLVIAVLLFESRLNKPTAITLLETATQSEKQNITRSRFTHRTLLLEARRPDSQQIVMRRSIEIWEDPNKGVARRVYENGQLVAGALTKPDGTQIVYHHATKSQITLRENGLVHDLDNAWLAEVSTGWFTTIVSNPSALSVTETSDSDLFSYRLKDGGLVSLRIRRQDLHATELNLLLTLHGELLQLRLTETELEQVRDDAVPPKIFEVETDFANSNAHTNEKSKSSAVLSSANTKVKTSASAELEIEVAYILNQLTSGQQDQILLARKFDGTLQVDAVVDSNERKQEILRALNPITRHSAVMINVHTVSEAAALKSIGSRVVAVDSTPTSDRVAADTDIRKHLSEVAGIHDVNEDEAVRMFSSTIVNHAYVLLRHAIALKQLTARFANIDMQTVAPDARAKWLEMLHQHSRALEREISLSRAALRPVFSGPNSGLSTAGFRIKNDRELTDSITQLRDLTVSCSNGMRSAFSTTAQGSDSAIKSAQFWLALSTAEQLAAAIATYK